MLISSLPCPPPGLQPMMPNQQQAAYQGMIGVQQPQNQGLLSNQRSGMGGQMQGLVVQYTPLPSYQVGAFCIGKDHPVFEGKWERRTAFHIIQSDNSTTKILFAPLLKILGFFSFERKPQETEKNLDLHCLVLIQPCKRVYAQKSEPWRKAGSFLYIRCSGVVFGKEGNRGGSVGISFR